MQILGVAITARDNRVVPFVTSRGERAPKSTTPERESAQGGVSITVVTARVA